MTSSPWLHRYPLLGYFTLTYSISWGGILVMLVAAGFNLTVLRPLDTGIIFMCMLFGPSVSGLAITALLDGRAGLGALWSRLLRWRVDLRWYAFALLSMPLLTLAVLLPFSLFVDPVFSPGFQWQMFAVGLIAGTFEEVGWTGFATPRLLSRWRPLVAGLLLGLVWAIWHVLVDVRQHHGAISAEWLLQFAVLYLATLMPYRILMTLMYVHTQSLLLAVLMHASYTSWLLALFPTTSVAQGLAWQASLAATLWLAVAVIQVFVQSPKSNAKSGSHA